MYVSLNQKEKSKFKINWDLSLIGDVSLSEVTKITKRFVEKWQNREDYLQDPPILKEALDEYNEWEEKYAGGGDEAYRVVLENALDQNNPELKAKYNKFHEAIVDLYNSIQFFPLKIAKISLEKQQLFLDASELQDYRYFLEGQFKIGKYLLSEKEEKILNLKSKVSYGNWVDMTSSFLSKEEREGKSFSEISSLLSDGDKKTRDKAAVWFNDILEKRIDTGEHEINSILETAKVDLKLRGYKRPDEPQHIGDDIETEVIDALLEAVTSSFDISQKYYELKAKLLGLEKLEYHERNVPFGKAEKEYSFDDAIDLVREAFEDLNPFFADTFNDFVTNGHFDVYPKKNKISGAGCWSNLKTQPSFIHLNFTGKLRDVTTIAHEMGHAIHNKLIEQSQKAIYCDVSLATAETASTFMEDFVTREILKDADDELRLALQLEQLNDLVSSVQRQTACYKFEQELHAVFAEKGYLSKEKIGEMFQKHMKSYMGDFVEQSEGSQNWWIYWGHIRRFFYVYSYASGLLISKSLQKKVKADPDFINEVTRVLSFGISKSPKDAFAQVGVDITDPEFWKRGLNEEKSLLEDTWTLAKKLGKI